MPPPPPPQPAKTLNAMRTKIDNHKIAIADVSEMNLIEDLICERAPIQVVARSRRFVSFVVRCRAPYGLSTGRIPVITSCVALMATPTCTANVPDAVGFVLVKWPAVVALSQ